MTLISKRAKRDFRYQLKAYLSQPTLDLVKIALDDNRKATVKGIDIKRLVVQELDRRKTQEVVNHKRERFLKAKARNWETRRVLEAQRKALKLEEKGIGIWQ